MDGTVSPQRILREAMRLIEMLIDVGTLSPDEQEAIDNSLLELQALCKALPTNIKLKG